MVTRFFVVILFVVIYLFIWLRWVFVAAHGFSLVVASRAYPLLQVHRLLIAVAFLIAEHGL